MRLIIVHLSGGLGNQLFQFAAAFALAQRHNTAICLETRAFRRVKSDVEDPAARPLRILDFDLGPVTFCSRWQEEVWCRRWALHRDLRIPAHWLGFYVERHFLFDRSFFDIRDGTCLRGYFQSELYFESVHNSVRAAFQPRDPLILARVDAQLAQFRKTGRDLVSLHIRRGDFLGLADRDCLTGDAFLEAAMAQFPRAHFLVFSDDLDWCHQRFAGRSDVSFSPFTRVLEDFFAMARCDHHILAKSTFSWWAAWLNDRPGTQIVAPRITPDMSWAGGSPDYYPKRWIQLD